MMEEKFKELVGISIGKASMCWSEIPSGTFDSERAAKIVDEIWNAIKPAREVLYAAELCVSIMKASARPPTPGPLFYALENLEKKLNTVLPGA